jgi:hypothetical protein
MVLKCSNIYWQRPFQLHLVNAFSLDKAHPMTFMETEGHSKSKHTHNNERQKTPTYIHLITLSRENKRQRKTEKRERNRERESEREREKVRLCRTERGTSFILQPWSCGI